MTTKRTLTQKILRILRNLMLLFFISSIGMVILYRFVPVYLTPLMVVDCTKQIFKGDLPQLYHHWVPLHKISSKLPQAVVAGEDNRFMEHWGVDTKELEKAVKENAKRKRSRGASTITQQTAKNVFLWSGHSYLRKGLELYFTVLIEGLWGKERIMEVYLNSIEMGKHIYGAEAVAQRHFSKSAKQLSSSQCALIAATLPNPVRFNSASPSSYVRKRQNKILWLMGKIGPVKFN